MNPIPSCKNFNGYKPCFPEHDCWTQGCKENRPIGKKILIINLDAMGDVVMTTAQLPGLKRAYPESTIWWITLKISAPLLENNPYLDKVLPYDFESLSILRVMHFDIVLSCDKSQRSCAIAEMVNASEKRGFGLNSDGKIYPFNKGAEYNFLLGMNNQLKFRENTRTGQDYLAETFEIPYQRDEYVFNFTEEEIAFTENYKNSVGIKAGDQIIGFNTGCSNLFPNKKMTIEQHIKVISALLRYKKFKILLLGGPEDTERNEIIASHFGNQIINTPTLNGVRKGACYMSIPDVVITGDSFGMHLAIALKKYVIAWFGLSCWTEIDLYDRGVKLFPEGLHCAPCWKKQCPYNLECIQMIDLEKIEREAVRYFDNR